MDFRKTMMMNPIFNTYFVGGYVRDKLAGIPSKDIDIACEAKSFNEMRQHIISLGCTIFLEREQFGAIRAKHPKYGPVDFTICRTDGFYSDGRRPDSILIGDIKSDLSRRDFTVNAIAENTETGEIIDPYNGREDIRFKTLRAVGKPEDRFREDSLRILRAFRFAIVKGYHLDYNIHLALIDNTVVSLLKKVSDERIRDEINKCFAYDTFKTLEYLKIYRLVYNILFDGQIRHHLKLTNERS